MASLITYSVIMVFLLFPPLLFFLLINDMVIPVPEVAQLKPRFSTFCNHQTNITTQANLHNQHNSHQRHGHTSASNDPVQAKVSYILQSTEKQPNKQKANKHTVEAKVSRNLYSVTIRLTTKQTRSKQTYISD